MKNIKRTPLYLAVWCLAVSVIQMALPVLALIKGSVFVELVAVVSISGAAITLLFAWFQWKEWKRVFTKYA